MCCLRYQTEREAIVHKKDGPIKNKKVKWGLEYQHWNTKHFEVPISNGSVLEWSLIAIAIAMIPTILKPNHWKFEQNGHHFVPISNDFRQNDQHFVQNRT